MAHRSETWKTAKELHFLKHLFLQTGMTGLQPASQKESCIGTESSFILRTYLEIVHPDDRGINEYNERQSNYLL